MHSFVLPVIRAYQFTLVFWHIFSWLFWVVCQYQYIQLPREDSFQIVCREGSWTVHCHLLPDLVCFALGVNSCCLVWAGNYSYFISQTTVWCISAVTVSFSNCMLSNVISLLLWDCWWISDVTFWPIKISL